MKHTLYLYLDNFSFSDSYATQCIACEAFMPNKKGTRTFSRNTHNFLFLTHKKLNKDARLSGIADHLTSWPVTIECIFDSDKYESFPVVYLLNDGVPSLELGDIRDYDKEKYIGCYVYGEIPFSSVSKILFENDDQLIDSDKSIFPDFLWDQKKVGVIDAECFVEDIDCSVSEPDILEQRGINEAADKIVAIGNKYRAAILQFINGTKQWQTDKYRATFDAYLLEYFSLSENVVKELLAEKQMPAPEGIFQPSVETLDLIPVAPERNNDNPEQDLFNSIIRVFLKTNEKCTAPHIHDLLEQIKAELIGITGEEVPVQFSNTIAAIEGCCLNSIGFTVDGVIKDIDLNFSENSILKALLFVVKNPADFEKFMLSLSLYRVDSISSRRAMVLWGFLNGTRGIPAFGYGRENYTLWENIEWKQGQVLNYIYRSVPSSEATCGIEIKSEEIITFEEVHAFLTADLHHISKSFLREIYTIAKNCDRKLSKDDPYCIYSINDENFYSKLPNLSKDVVTKAELDAFEKAYTKKFKELMSGIKKTAALDNHAIYQNWVVNASNFKKIWDLIEDQIKAYYVRKRG